MGPVWSEYITASNISGCQDGSLILGTTHMLTLHVGPSMGLGFEGCCPSYNLVLRASVGFPVCFGRALTRFG